jgi:hypothetical protein
MMKLGKVTPWQSPSPLKTVVLSAASDLNDNIYFHFKNIAAYFTANDQVAIKTPDSQAVVLQAAPIE